MKIIEISGTIDQFNKFKEFIEECIPATSMAIKSAINDKEKLLINEDYNFQIVFKIINIPVFNLN